jgi:hypothetical protein
MTRPPPAARCRPGSRSPAAGRPAPTPPRRPGRRGPRSCRAATCRARRRRTPASPPRRPASARRGRTPAPAPPAGAMKKSCVSLRFQAAATAATRSSTGCPAASRCCGPATTPARRRSKRGGSAARSIVVRCASGRHRRDGPLAPPGIDSATDEPYSWLGLRFRGDRGCLAGCRGPSPNAGTSMCSAAYV